ncbi:MAG: hypothetical protein NC038_07765 [Paludibacter sp.]|nr:hypothetical protein [Prevotella sp.]MCM1443639.1 hypothetical protein [Muribaculum sp.]MCM1482514.1 hypothetical protein [Paludibacter sp.]MCM1576890.1 hypothetical protein [Bacteroides sp.]
MEKEKQLEAVMTVAQMELLKIYERYLPIVENGGITKEELELHVYLGAICFMLNDTKISEDHIMSYLVKSHYLRLQDYLPDYFNL